MKIAYICEDGTKIGVSGNSISVKKGDKKIAEIPMNVISSILIFGNCQATTDALNRLTKRGIRTAWLTKTGKLKFYVAGPENLSHNKIRQYCLYLNQDKRLLIAKMILKRKISSQVFYIKNYFREMEGKESFLKEAELKSRQIERCKKLEELRGYEGYLTRMYFSSLSSTVKNASFTFQGRKYHPTTDRFNCALSLAYGFCKQVIASTAIALGFDPFIGYLHEFNSSKEAFVYDLIEEFRPFADWRIVKMVNKKQLKEEMFINENNGEYRFNPECFKNIIQLFHEEIISFNEPRYSCPFYEAGGIALEEISTEMKRILEEK